MTIKIALYPDKNIATYHKQLIDLEPLLLSIVLYAELQDYHGVERLGVGLVQIADAFKSD